MPEFVSPASPRSSARPALGDFRRYFGIVRRGWRLVAITILVCLTLAVIYLASTRRKYQATARVMVLQQGGRPLNVANTDPNRLMEEADDYIPTHAGLMSSPLVIQGAISSAGLYALPTLLAESEKDRDPVEAAILSLKVTRPDRLAKILKVDYRANSAEEATTTLEAILASYDKIIEHTFHRKSSEVVTLIAKARDELGRELKGLEDKYLELRQKGTGLALDESGRPFALKRLEQWDHAANAANIKSIEIKAQLGLGRTLANQGTELWAIAHALGQVGGDPSSLNAALNSGGSLNGTADYIRQLTQEQQSLSERFGPQFAKVRELQDQISRAQERNRSARGRLERGEVKDLLNSIEQGLHSVEAMRDELMMRFEQEQARSKQDEIGLLSEVTLRGNMERQRSLFNTVVDQLKQAQFAGDFSSVSIQTIEPPKALPRPVRPIVPLVLALALVSGCMAGVMVAFVADGLDNSIRTIEELRETLDLSLLGQVPEVRRQDAIPGQFGLICETMPRSTWAESFRAIRTNVDVLCRRQDIRVLLISSPHPGDGKSTVSSNVAISLAQAGRTVLLIDADLRKPTQAGIRNLPGKMGLVQILRDSLPIHRAVQATSVANLDLIASGPEISNPSELLSSPRMVAFLSEARASYDVVIIDSPPLLAVTDSAIVGNLVDGVMLVIRMGSLKRAEASRIKDQVARLGSVMLGMLINRVGHKEAGYGYCYGYGSSSNAETAADREPHDDDRDVHEGGYASSNGSSN
jgi:succinoglycan biosynthesis transport protein ExoP